MEYLNFNIYGFTNPKTMAEYTRLLQEALMIADDLLADIACIGEALEKNAAATA